METQLDDFTVAHQAIAKLILAVQSDDTKRMANILYLLERIYEGGDEITRYRIVNGIVEANCRTPRVFTFLAKVLNTAKSPLVCHEAAFAIGVLDAEGHLLWALKQTLKFSKSPIVLHETAIALADIGDESCLELLEATARNNDGFVASSAKYALRLIRLRLNL